MANVRIGCSGWIYRSWKGVFHPPDCPQRRWLAAWRREADVFGYFDNDWEACAPRNARRLQQLLR
ncbi:MAG TPA: hypothetical protein VK501_09795 [Baekduia sp.]|uniref:hypothetical protein n=1 Tax=Baekduia sp. TaxID=2600305 RepID=UPI002D118439|nr:hypothetical protein [Baekduia sp.]HMJ34199.1 hypothetical protein [Baekduia sp.]